MSNQLRRTRCVMIVIALIPVCASGVLSTTQMFAQAGSASPRELSCSPPVPAGVSQAPTASAVGATPALAAGTSKIAERIGIEPAQIDTRVLSANETATLTVRNESLAQVSAIDLSLRELIDSKTSRKYGPFRWNAKLNNPLQTNQRTDCTFHLPVLTNAGAYTGVLRLTVGERETTIPIMAHSRGPILYSWYWLPLFLTVVTVIVGWGISLILDQWYTTGLPRAQAVLILREQRAAIGNFSSRLSKWETANKLSTPDADLVAAFDLSEVDTALKLAKTLDVAELQQLTSRFAITTHLNDEFWTAVQIAKLKVPGADLAQTVTRLDAVPRPSDPMAYRASMLQVLTTPPPVARLAIGAAISASIAGVDLSGVSSASLRRRMAVMDFVKWFVLALAVLVTSYTVYYLPNTAFGTLQDYLTLLIWALGVSTTGSKLVSSIHK